MSTEESMVEAEQRLTALVSDHQTVALAQGMDDALIDELDGTADKSAGDARTQGPMGPPLPAGGGHGRCFPRCGGRHVFRRPGRRPEPL